jgi:cysteine desulfurase
MAIYLDHAATTPLHPDVLDAMLPYLREHHGNPSSIHASGRRARQGIDEARERIAAVLGAKPREVVFTSGGTEADNLAVKGIAWAGSARGRHIVTSAVEHKAVLNACAMLERSGFEITYLPVDRYARVDPDDVAAAITQRTVLVSVMAANNEVGTIQPVGEIGAVCRAAGVAFHTDAVQCAPFAPPDANAWQATAVTLSAHKAYGPKGIGALYVRQGTPMVPQQQGGSQERQRRAGTEDVPSIVGFGAAMARIHADAAARAAENARQAGHRDRLIAGATSIQGVQLTGHPVERLPNSASFVIDGVEGGDVVAALDLEGVEASTGSACTTGSVDPSHVLVAMGIPADVAAGSLRLTVGEATTSPEIDRALEALETVVTRLRAASATAGVAAVPA